LTESMRCPHTQHIAINTTWRTTVHCIVPWTVVRGKCEVDPSSPIPYSPPQHIPELRY
jgi:hypothetical protein